MLSITQRDTLLNVGRAMIPAGQRVAAFDGESLNRLETLLSHLPEAEGKAFIAMVDVLNGMGWPIFGKPLREVPVTKLQDWITRMFEGNPPVRAMLRLLAAPIKTAHFNHAGAGDPFGFKYRCSFVKDEPFPWLQSVFTPETWEEEEIECDVAVIGTGAGGAVAAKELAEKGLAVLMLEKGRLHRRETFGKSPAHVLANLYVGGGANATLGLPVVSLPVGMSVGGSTTVNSGTCLRAPDRIFERWRRELGLPFTEEMMTPLYDRVGGVMQVEPARMQFVGKVGEIIERGCNALGYAKHGPLPRNAPDCDGQGTCCFGCPTDAKRSTNVSYVPLAIRAGASLLAGFEVTRFIIENGAITGLHAVGRTAEGGERHLKVIARAVVVAGGALFTPLLLQKNGIGLHSGWLGRNLSIHPAVATLAIMDEEVRGYNGIPQGYGVDQFHDEGILLEGGFMPLEIMGTTVSPHGQRYTRLMDQYNHMAIFAGMIEDTSRGHVVADPLGNPRVFYNLNRHDIHLLTKLTHYLVDIFHAAGAREIIPMVGRWPSLRSQRDIAMFRRYKPGRLDLEANAFHPLGTARMGADPAASVVGPDHQVHGVKGLYIADGSVVPSALGVNPQMTIMAMATRAAAIIAGRLSGEESGSETPGITTAA